MAPAASLPMCRVLSSLCRPLLSGLPPASSNSLCSVIPPPHPGGWPDMAWAVCVDSKLGQLHSSSLPCLSSPDPPWPDAQFFSQPELHIFWPVLSRSLKPVAGHNLSCSSISVNRVCHDRTGRALPPWAGGRQVLLPGMVAMVLWVTVMESLTWQHPATIVATVILPFKM